MSGAISLLILKGAVMVMTAGRVREMNGLLEEEELSSVQEDGQGGDQCPRQGHSIKRPKPSLYQNEFRRS